MNAFTFTIFRGELIHESNSLNAFPIHELDTGLGFGNSIGLVKSNLILKASKTSIVNFETKFETCLAIFTFLGNFKKPSQQLGFPTPPITHSS